MAVSTPTKMFTSERSIDSTGMLLGTRSYPTTPIGFAAWFGG